MKSKLLTLALAITLLLTCQIALAQVEQNAKDRSRFGIKAGANYSTINYGGATKFSSDLGFNAGLTYSLLSGKKLTLPVEVMYVTYASHTAFSDYKFSSANINFMANYFASKHFFIEGGLVMGIYTSGDVTNKTTKIKSDLLANDMTPVDVALGLGLGYELTNRVYFNLRGSYGLLGVFLNDDNSSHLICPTFNIGYSF